MSYSIYLEGVAAPPCPTCGRASDEEESPDCPNPTYNLTPIFDLALTGEGLPNPDVAEVAVVLFREETDRPRGLRLLSERTGRDSIAALDAAISRMDDDGSRPAFLALEPANGWGDFSGARKVIGQLRALAERYPDHVWRIC